MGKKSPPPIATGGGPTSAPTSPSPPPPAQTVVTIPVPNPSSAPSATGIGLGTDGGSITAVGTSGNDSFSATVETASERFDLFSILTSSDNTSVVSQTGWITGSASTNPYTGMPGSSTGLAPFSGQNVDTFTNMFVGYGSSNPYTGTPPVDPLIGSQTQPAFPASVDPPTPPSSSVPSTDMSQALASNDRGPLPTTASDTGPLTYPTYLISQIPVIDTQTIDGVSYAHNQITLDGLTYDAYTTDRQNTGYSLLIPTSNPANSATPQQIQAFAAIPVAATAPEIPATPSTAMMSPPNVPSLAGSGPNSGGLPTIIGDVVAQFVALFGPSSVAPSVHLQPTPGLPPGLQTMQQLTTSAIPQAMRFNSVVGRTGFTAAVAPYAAAVGAFAAPAVGDLGFSVGVQIASRAPRATAFGVAVVAGLSGTPSVGSAGGTSLAPAIVPSADPLGPELPAALPAIEGEVRTSLPALAPDQNKIVAVNAAFAKIVDQQNKLLASNVNRFALQHLSIPEYAASMVAPARAYGQILERMVASAVNADPDLAPSLRYVGGAYRPDWVGLCELEGLCFDLTTSAGAAAHYARPYGENLIVHTYDRDIGLGF